MFSAVVIGWLDVVNLSKQRKW